MKVAGQSPREPRHPIEGKARSNQVGSGSDLRSGGAEASLTPGLQPKLSLRRPVRVGAWNVTSLQEDARIHALSKELCRLGVSVAALSEVRRPGKGQISIGGYTYYWSGRADGRHTEGVAVAVADRLAPQIRDEDVTPVSERIMRLRIPHTLGWISVVAVYAPTGVSDVTTKEAFYAKLHAVVDAIPKVETLIVLGDFNATTGTSRDGYESCVGPYGSGRRDESSSMLVDFARSHGLKIAGSWFQRADPRRWTWYSNDGVTRKEIDHILVSGRWSLVQNCRVFRSAEFFGGDHRLLVATLKLRFRVPRRAAPGQERRDVGRLRDPDVAQAYANKLAESLAELDNSVDPQTLWSNFKHNILKVAGESIPKPPKRREEGISQETVDIIEESRKARLAGKTVLRRELRRRAVKAVRRDKEARVRELCEAVESHITTSDSRLAYRAIRKLRSSGPPASGLSVRAADGTILSEEAEVKARWAGYFEELYRVDPPRNEISVDGVEALVADPPISCEPPTLEETRKALDQLKEGKAPGSCGIHVEMLKAGGEPALMALHNLFCSIWDSGVVPTDWKRGIVVPIWKGKGDTRECNNYRGVTLLSVPGKAFARVILNRMRPQLLKHQRPEQSGFTPKKSTVDRILALRVLTERYREFDKGLLAAYIDFRKAFDSVCRDALWKLLELRGIPPRLVQLITSLYSDTESAVKCGGSTSDFFPVHTGVRQGCVLAPSLFSACMDWIMGQVTERTSCGASFGELQVTDLDFADDAVILAETVEALTEALEALSEESEPLGLRVSWVKTKIQAFGDILDAATESLPVAGENVDVVETFTYLGSVVHRSASCEAEVNRRLGLAMGVMNSLDKSVWRSRHLSRRTKVRVFRSLVMSVLLYSCEAWTLTDGLRRRLDSFATTALRRIFGYRWQDHVSNREVLDRAEMGRVTCLIRERQLRFYGHVVRLPSEDPAHRILNARDPAGWNRRRGRPNLSWLAQLSNHLKEWSLGPAQARTIAQKRPRAWSTRVSAAKCRRGTCSHT